MNVSLIALNKRIVKKEKWMNRKGIVYIDQMNQNL